MLLHSNKNPSGLIRFRMARGKAFRSHFVCRAVSGMPGMFSGNRVDCHYDRKYIAAESDLCVWRSWRLWAQSGSYATRKERNNEMQ